MDKEQAKVLLLKHSFSWEDVSDPKMEFGFMGSLRPYSGLREENFHDVMEAIQTLAPDFMEEKVDREVMSALWGICTMSKLWGLDEDGMLQRNHLISREETQILSEWVNAIGYAMTMLLDSGSMEAAFDGYQGRPGIV